MVLQVMVHKSIKLKRNKQKLKKKQKSSNTSNNKTKESRTYFSDVDTDTSDSGNEVYYNGTHNHIALVIQSHMLEKILKDAYSDV